MLKKQKKQVFVFGIVAILSISLATPVAEAVLDIEGIYMTSCKDHLDGTAGSTPWCFEVQIDLVDPGTLHHIDVTPPPGGTLFTIYEDWYYDSPSSYPSLASLQIDYPAGTYTLDFCNSINTVLRSVNLDNSGLSEPVATVNFTYPSINGQMGISTIPTFTWTVDPGAGDALGMWLWDPFTQDDVYENVPVSMDTLAWQPGSLDPGHTYGLDVSVFRAKDGLPGPPPALPTMTVGPDTFVYGLLIEYLNEINFTTAPAIGPSSGWIFMPDIPDIGYYLDEDCWLYFYSSVPVWNYNITDDVWNTVGPKGLIYANWPFIYELDSGDLWFALPPESGLWVYHFCTGEWTVLPRIIPW